MKTLVKHTLLPAFLCFFCSFATSKPLYSDIQQPARLINELKSGGYIIYMRHGKTKRKNKSKDKQTVDLTNCSTQRNLTEEGVREAIKIGKILKTLNIPIGSVSSSPYCRTKDTAQAVFGRYVIDDMLAFSFSKMKAESKVLGEYLIEAMKSSTNTTDNIVFVGHTANLKDGLGVWPKPEGVIAVFKKQDDKIIYKGMITPKDWFSN